MFYQICHAVMLALFLVVALLIARFVFVVPEISKRRVENSHDKFRLSLGTTIRSRYNASVRLSNMGRFNFLTTTVLSLGLIFIPLMEGYGFDIKFGEDVRRVFQIFLAISVLVYSVSTSMLRYDIRADKMDCCADDLKDLAREFDSCFGVDLKSVDFSDGSVKKLDRFKKRYSRLMGYGENHGRNDYIRAVLDMPHDYKISVLDKFCLCSRVWLCSLSYYLLPIFLILTEIVFIFDMIGVTSFFGSY